MAKAEPSMTSMQIQIGKKTLEISAIELRERINGCKHVLIDIGTGDGLFVYRWAATHANTYCIGIDAAALNMRNVSAKTIRKPAKGGLPNALFIVAGLERLPAEIQGLADTITINFPWGTLLKALVTPDVQSLKAIACLAQADARLIVLINYSVFQDQDYATRIGLPNLTQEFIQEVLKPKYAAASIEITGYAFLQKEVPHRTTWGQHLILGSSRETLMIEAVIRSPGSVKKTIEEQ